MSNIFAKVNGSVVSLGKAPVADHAQLTDLDFDHSGHSGFTSTAQLDTEVTNRKNADIELQENIDGTAADIEILAEEVDAISNSLVDFANKKDHILQDTTTQTIDFTDLFVNINGVVNKILSLGIEADANGKLTFIVNEGMSSAEVSEFTYDLSTRNLAIKDSDNVEFTVNLPQITATNDGLMTSADYNKLKELSDIVASISTGGLWRQSFDTYSAMETAYPGLDVSSTNWLVNDFVFVLADENRDATLKPETSYIVQVNGEVKTLAFRKLEDIPIKLATNTSSGVVLGTASTDGKIYIESDGSMSLIGYDKLVEDTEAKIPKVEDAIAGNFVIQKSDGTLEDAGSKPGDFAKQNTTIISQLIQVNKTISMVDLQTEIDKLPKNLMSNVIFNVDSGTITTAISISGFTGNGKISIFAAIDTTSGTHNINNLEIFNNANDSILIRGFNITGTDTSTNSVSIIDNTCAYININYLNISLTNPSGRCVYVSSSKVKFESCIFNNASIAINADIGSDILVSNCSGNNNEVAYSAISSGIINLGPNNIIAGTLQNYLTANSGLIINDKGIIYPKQETNLINNLTTNTTEQGALDAYQGYILNRDKVSLRYSIIGSEQVTTTPWYEIAVSNLATGSDMAITFLVQSLNNAGVNPGRIGILNCAVTVVASGATPKMELTWLAVSGFNPNDFVLAYDAENALYRLFAFNNTPLDYLHFRELEQSQRRNELPAWTVNPAPTGIISIPPNYISLVSKRGDIGMVPLYEGRAYNTTTAPLWYRWAYTTITNNEQAVWFTLLVQEVTNPDPASIVADEMGILNVNVRRKASGLITNAQWMVVAGLDVSDFILAYNSINSVVELWVRARDVAYKDYRYRVLESGSNGLSDKWTFESASTGVSEPTPGYTQVISTRSDIGMMPLKESLVWNADTTSLWYEVASGSINAWYQNFDAFIAITDAYGWNNNTNNLAARSGTGFLHINVRSHSSSSVPPEAIIEWHSVSGLNPSDFVLCIRNETVGVSIRLFSRIALQFDALHFVELSTDSRVLPHRSYITPFTYSSGSVGQAVLPSEYIQVVSTVAQTQHPTFTNENLLVDWDWTNPVNSRGQNTYLAGDFYDNWLNGYSTLQISKEDGFTRITAVGTAGNSGVSQRPVNYKELASKQVILSAIFRTTEATAFRIESVGYDNSSVTRLNFPNTEGEWQLIQMPISLPANTNANTRFGLSANPSVPGQILDIKAWELCVGSVSTLMNRTLGGNYNTEYVRTTGLSPMQSNINILDNVAGTINQSGLTSWENTGIMFDRWNHNRNNQAVITLSNGIIHWERTKSITSNDMIHQYFENTRLIAGETYCFSLRYRSNRAVRVYGILTAEEFYKDFPASSDWTIQSVVWTAAATPTAAQSHVAIALHTSNAAIGDYIEFNTSRPFVKLERGTSSTLANDNPPNYSIEFMKCQYYQQVIGKNSTYVAENPRAQGNTNQIDFFIPLTSPLRLTSPTLTPISGFLIIQDFNGTNQNGFTFTAISTGNSMIIRAAKTAHGITGGARLWVSNVLLNANL